MFNLACSPMTIALQPRMAWTEDRALLRSNPSAAPGAKTGVGIGPSGPSRSLSPTLRDWRKAKNLDGTMPSSPPQDAPRLAYAQLLTFQFTVNQDTRAFVITT